MSFKGRAPFSSGCRNRTAAPDGKESATNGRLYARVGGYTAERDSIASEYVTGFAITYGIGERTCAMKNLLSRF